MEIKEIQLKKKEVVTDIICDCCGKSCKVRDDIIDNPTRIDDKEPFYEFEYMSLNASWGYNSDKDCQNWSAQVCEKCVTDLLSFIRFKKELAGKVIQ